MRHAAALPDGYQPLTVEEVPAYVRSRPGLSALVPGDPLHVREVGDGNLNLVFIVRSEPDAPGVVLKQSLPWVRVVGEGWPLTIERARHEADAYAAYQPFAGGANPRYHGFDATRYVIAMEDLAGLRVWRSALNDAEVHIGAARDLGEFIARVAFHTSDLGMAAADRKALLARTINPEMCRITEDLVFTEPLRDHEHNWYQPALEPTVQQLRADVGISDALAVLKHRFMTHGEALIHGDLHTGSVMVGGGRTAAIDPEFSFTGPVGFDLGMLWANAVFAAARAAALDRPAMFRHHVAAILPDSWAAFTAEVRRLWPSRVDDGFTDGMLSSWLATVWDDALGFAGAELVRRLIGFAHVSDIETLDETARGVAAMGLLRIARAWLLERAGLTDPGAAWVVVEGELRLAGWPTP